MTARKVRRVVRKPAGAGRKPVVRRPTQTAGPKSKPFSFLPEAHAVGPALGTVIKGGLRVAATVKQLKGVNRLRPTHDKTIKSVTYKNVIEGPIMKKTGGGVPLYKGYDETPPTFGVMQSGRADTRLFDLTGVKHPNVGAATRANQAMMSSGSYSAKHTVKKKSFVKINKGGPVMEFPGGTQTRYRKRSTKTVKTSGELVKGQDATYFPTRSEMGSIQKETLRKTTGLDKYMAAPAVVATVPLWDQIGNFFNPMPEAHAAGVSTLVAMAAKHLTKNVKTTFASFAKKEGIADTAANRAEFLKIKAAFVKGKNQIQLSPNFRPGGGQAGAGKGGKMDRKAEWKLKAKYGVMGVGSLATVGVVTNPEFNQWFTDWSGAGTGASTVIPEDVTVDETTSTDETVVVPPVIPYGTEGSFTKDTLNDAQTAFEEGLIVSASATGPQPTIRYGLPNEVGKPDPAYTKMSYKKYAPKHADADKDGFIIASQWVKLGMTGGMTSDTMSTLMTRQANRDNVNAVHANVMAGIQKHVQATPPGGDKLKAAADKAEELYADPTNAAILGSLPRQYQEILNRDLTKQEAGKYGKALLWQAGKAPADAKYGYTQGTVRDDGTYPVTITPGGKDNPAFLKKPKDETE